MPKSTIKKLKELEDNIRKALQQGKARKALRLCKQHQKLASDHWLRAMNQWLFASAHAQLNQHAQAIAALKKGLEFIQACPSILTCVIENKIHMTESLCEMLKESQQIPEAIKYNLHLLVLIKTCPLPKQQQKLAKVLMELATLYGRIATEKSKKQSINCLHQVIKLKHGKDIHALHYLAYFLLARHFQHNPSKTRDYLLKSKQVYDQHPELKQQYDTQHATTLLTLGSFYADCNTPGDKAKAIKLINQAINILQRYPHCHQQDLIVAHEVLGVVYFHKRNWPKCQTHLSQVYKYLAKLAKKSPLSAATLQSMTKLVYAYKQLGYKDKTLALLKFLHRKSQLANTNRSLKDIICYHLALHHIDNNNNKRAASPLLASSLHEGINALYHTHQHIHKEDFLVLFHELCHAHEYASKFDIPHQDKLRSKIKLRLIATAFVNCIIIDLFIPYINAIPEAAVKKAEHICRWINKNIQGGLQLDTKSISPSIQDRNYRQLYIYRKHQKHPELTRIIEKMLAYRSRRLRRETTHQYYLQQTTPRTYSALYLPNELTLLFNDANRITTNKTSRLAHYLKPSSIPSQAQKLIAILQQHGHTSWIVGGFIRDTIVGVSPNDIDITTTANYGQLLQLFSSAAKIQGRGIYHSLAITINGLSIDVCHQATSIAQSCHLRDLNINALVWNPIAHVLYDYENGLEDLTKKRIDFVTSNAKNRIEQSPIIILRAVVSALKLNFSLSLAVIKSIQRNSSRLFWIDATLFDRKAAQIAEACSNQAQSVRLLQRLGIFEIMQARSPELLTATQLQLQR